MRAGNVWMDFSCAVQWVDRCGQRKVSRNVEGCQADRSSGIRKAGQFGAQNVNRIECVQEDASFDIVWASVYSTCHSGVWLTEDDSSSDVIMCTVCDLVASFSREDFGCKVVLSLRLTFFRGNFRRMQTAFQPCSQRSPFPVAVRSGTLICCV